MLQEKYRFRKSPYNYAMRKTQLMKERDMALLKYVADDVDSLPPITENLMLITVFKIQQRRGRRNRTAHKRIS